MNSFCSLDDDDFVDTRFVLKNINPGQLDKQYLLQDLQDIGIEELAVHIQTPSDNTSKITSSLESVGISKNKFKPHETITLNDLNFRIFVSPVVSSSQLANNEIDSFVDIRTLRRCSCWHCRHPIPQEWHPLGIPVRYRTVDDTFEVEGVFCSFNCIASYLSEHTDYRYKESTVLLAMLHRRIFGVSKKMTDILPAPSWKLLKDYGGFMSIEEFRKCLQITEFRSLHQALKKDKLRLQATSEIFVEA